MIPFDEALEIVMNVAQELETEAVPLEDADGRILAQDVASDMDMPPFDKSAMDGYACRREDLGNELTVIEEIPAGYVPRQEIKANQCAKIMTGGMVPAGADCVIMVEFTEQVGDDTIRFTGKETRKNICLRAEDITKGDHVLSRGIRLRAQHIAVLATAGCTNPLVYRQPRVGVVATGSELVTPDKEPAPSQIRNSNSYQICAHVRSALAIPTYYGIAQDTEESLDRQIKTAMAENDVIILSGGVSMGDYDLVPGMFEKNGFKLLFHRIEIQPGRPVVFGASEEAICFGLPGNPVSTFVTFELIVKPFLFKMMGHDFKPVDMPFRLDRTFVRRKAKRTAWIPVAFSGDGGVAPIEYHGSAHLHALSEADGMISVPVGVNEVEKGNDRLC